MKWNACKKDAMDGDISSATIGRKIDNNMIICASISRPPKFNPDRFGDYKKRVRWWAEMQWAISDSRLSAAIGMHANGPSKMALYDYFQSSRGDPAGRPIELFIIALDKRNKQSAQGILLRKMAAWGRFQKETHREIPRILDTVRPAALQSKFVRG